ncbi:MAG TPA: hypothetical protein VL947_02435, partial [Cytophagales bacterium]|nr:hypothetical protein [Cytophagales bacterium]
MGYGKHLFWCLVWVCTSLCKAQNDTIVVYDTIYEVKDPIIIIQPVDSVPQYVITQPWLSLGGGIGSQRFTGGVPVKDGRLS